MLSTLFELKSKMKLKFELELKLCQKASKAKNSMNVYSLLLPVDKKHICIYFIVF